jgi:hypothetical protein
VLDLHLVEENGTIFGKFNLTSTTNKHLDGSLWSKVSLEHFLESFSSIDVNTEGLSLSNDICVCVDELEG